MIKIQEDKLIIEIPTSGSPFETLAGFRNAIHTALAFTASGANNSEAYEMMIWNFSRMLREISTTENQDDILYNLHKKGDKEFAKVFG